MYNLDFEPGSKYEPSNKDRTHYLVPMDLLS